MAAHQNGLHLCVGESHVGNGVGVLLAQALHVVREQAVQEPAAHAARTQHDLQHSASATKAALQPH